MPSLKEQITLRERLQTVEDDLLAAGKRHVTIDGIAGVFEWTLPKALDEQAEKTQADDIQQIEDMIVSQEWQDILVACNHGSFSWKPRPNAAIAGFVRRIDAF